MVLARFGAPHGVRGEIRLKVFAEDPARIGDYGPLDAADGRQFALKSLRPASGGAPDMLIARIDGIDDRNAAERLNGVELSVPRERLPDPDPDDFYHADLIGLAAESPSGEAIGTVLSVQNYGAGDLLEIAPGGAPSLLVPFTRAAVPTVDIAKGRVVVVLPEDAPEDEGDESV